jgi:2-hydroxychromene-2-carboxylate isomerase
VSSAKFDPLTSAAPLIAYLDYKSTYAYLAKDVTYALADELGIEIDWRPFTLDIPSYLGSARLDTSGRVVENQRSGGQWNRVRYAYRDGRRYGAPRGLVVRGTTKTWDSSLAGIGMLWAKAQGKAILRAYTDLVYDRFWKRELDIEDAGVIERVLREAGAPTADFRAYAAGPGRALHDEIQQAAFDAGIFGVPTYILEGERFFGREHLPRIRWMLTGRHGPPPDVAYEDFENPVGAARKTLTVAIDFRNPYALLAIEPTCRMAEEVGVAVDWLPFFVSPWRRRSAPSNADDRGTRHRRFRAEYAEREVWTYASDRGLALGNLYRDTDSTLAAIGLLWARRESASMAQPYVQRVFDRYWREELDIQDEKALRALMADIGIPVSGFGAFAAGDGRAEVERLQSELVAAGVFDVPTYRLDDELFVGRQHLPHVRSLLARA